MSDLLAKYQAQGAKVRLRAIGKTGIEFFRFQGIEIYKSYEHISSNPDYEKACSIINEAVQDFLDRQSDKIIIIHNGYKNMISQELKELVLIPVEPLKITNENEVSNSALDFEPEGDELLQDLMKTYFEYNMYFALIDSLAAEHSARMQAMDNASNNAKAMLKHLNLAYNKARQENITTELTEIVSGVESMK